MEAARPPRMLMPRAADPMADGRARGRRCLEVLVPHLGLTRCSPGFRIPLLLLSVHRRIMAPTITVVVVWVGMGSTVAAV
jgi:hypothetical protein